jgi:colanic acid biosynthesis glycosyl transferase WcaI
MRLLLLTAYFPPESGAGAHLFHGLATGLARRGHQVTVVTGMPTYHVTGDASPYRGRWRHDASTDGVRVLRLAALPFPARGMFARGLWQISVALSSLCAALFLPRQHAVIVLSPPLFLGLTAVALRWLRGWPFVLHVQDLFPRSAVDLGALRHPMLVRLFSFLERFLYRRAACVLVHSEGNLRHVTARGAASARVLLNWVDTDALRPGPRRNSFRDRLALHDAFVATYAGVFGLSHGMEVWLHTASLLRHRPGILFLLIGDGLEKDRLLSRARELGLANVRFLPMLPRAEYAEALAASDVCLVSLAPAVRTPVVPSKINSILAAGRPILASLDPHSDAAQLILRAGAGLVVPAADAASAASALEQLRARPEDRLRFAASGRAFAEQELSLTRAARAYEELLATFAPSS